MDEPTPVTIEPRVSQGALGIADSLRASIAGGHAAALIGASTRLFEAGGKQLLSESTKRTIRHAAERGATSAIAAATAPVLGGAVLGLESGGALGGVAVKAGAVQVGVAAGKAAMRAAGSEILKGAGKAAGIGFVIDGAVAGFEAVLAVRNGSSDKKTAAIYVAREATTGAIATGAGVLLGASLVALTGGLAAPVVFAASAFGSIGTKRLLRRLTS